MRTLVFWLSLLFIFTIPFEVVLLVGGSANSATFTKFIGLAMAGLWVSTVLVTDKIRQPHPFHVIAFLFVLWNAASIYWTIDIISTLTRLITYVQLTGLVYIIWDMYLTPERLKAGMQSYVLGAYVSTGSTLYNYFSGVSVYTTNGYYDRYAASNFDANELSLILALGVPLAWHLATSKKTNKWDQMFRVINYAYLPIAPLGILLAASRAGLICVSIAFLYVLRSYTRLKFITRILIFFILAGSLFVLQPLIPESSLDRISDGMDEVGSGNFGGRTEVWLQGLNIFIEHPLTGVGSAAFRYATVLDKASHNSFLAISAELGVVGLILFLIICLIVFHSAIHRPKWESRLWLTMLLVWAIGASSLDWAHRKPTLLLMSLIVASANLPKRYPRIDEPDMQYDISAQRTLVRK